MNSSDKPKNHSEFTRLKDTKPHIRNNRPICHSSKSKSFTSIWKEKKLVFMGFHFSLTPSFRIAESFTRSFESIIIYGSLEPGLRV